MNFIVGQLVGWRHDLPDFHEKVLNHGRGPFELQGVRQEKSRITPANQNGRLTCVASRCAGGGQEQHCLYLLLQTKLGLVELSANQFMSLR